MAEIIRVSRPLKPWRCCQAESPDGVHMCTQRVYPAASAAHAGDHVAEGRAEGEPDSEVARWANRADQPHEYAPSSILKPLFTEPACRVCGLHGH